MNRYKVSLLVIVCFVMVACAGNPKRPSTSQPNIIIIFSDDAGYADFGFNGSKENIRPRILTRLPARVSGLATGMSVGLFAAHHGQAC